MALHLVTVTCGEDKHSFKGHTKLIQIDGIIINLIIQYACTCMCYNIIVIV